MAMGEQEHINFFGIKTEILAIFFVHLPAALVHAAVDENGFVLAAYQVTGSCYIKISAVEFKLYRLSL